MIEHGLLLSVLGLRLLKARVYSVLGLRLLKARAYVVGNPLIAAQMTSEGPIAGLYVPLRLLVYEADGRTLITYDQPSSLLSQLPDETIMRTARMLDDRLLCVVKDIATP